MNHINTHLGVYIIPNYQNINNDLNLTSTFTSTKSFG
jgi:hypothetical protein